MNGRTFSRLVMTQEYFQSPAGIVFNLNLCRLGWGLWRSHVKGVCYRVRGRWVLSAGRGGWWDFSRRMNVWGLNQECGLPIFLVTRVVPVIMIETDETVLFDSWVKRKPTWCHLFYYFIQCSFNAQHVSAVNTTIFRSLRLIDQLVAGSWRWSY